MQRSSHEEAAGATNAGGRSFGDRYRWMGDDGRSNKPHLRHTGSAYRRYFLIQMKSYHEKGPKSENAIFRKIKLKFQYETTQKLLKINECSTKHFIGEISKFLKTGPKGGQRGQFVPKPGFPRRSEKPEQFFEEPM